MKRFLAAAFILMGFLAVTASGAVAQDYRSSIGWNAGVMLTTSLNDGASDAGGGVELKPDPTWSVGGHFDRWFGPGLLGGRLSAGLARNVLPWTQGDRSVYSYRADASLMLRLGGPRPERTVIPFISAGVGIVQWGLGDGPVTTFNAAGARYSGNESFQPLGLAGLGLDYVTPFEWGEGPMIVRLEGKDHIQLASPFDPLDPEGGDFGIIHQIYLSLGLHTGIDVLGGRR